MNREGRKGTRSKPVIDFPLRAFASFAVKRFCFTSCPRVLVYLVVKLFIEHEHKQLPA